MTVGGDEEGILLRSPFFLVVSGFRKPPDAADDRWRREGGDHILLRSTAPPLPNCIRKGNPFFFCSLLSLSLSLSLSSTVDQEDGVLWAAAGQEVQGSHRRRGRRRNRKGDDVLPADACGGLRGAAHEEERRGKRRGDDVLFPTDACGGVRRVLLPVSKASDPRRGGAERLVFTFSDSELHEFWDGEGLPVTVLDRWGREYNNGGLLRRWGRKRWIVLKGGGGGVWPGAARSMGLKAHDTVELLSLRVRRPPKETAGRLVLVLLPARSRDPDVVGQGWLRSGAAQ